MANHFPSLVAPSVASLQYVVQMTSVAGPVNSVPSGTFNLVNWEFQQAPVAGILQFSYAGFDQDTYEASLKTQLTGMCTAMATNLGVSLATIQAAMTVMRVWALYQPVLVGAAYPGVTVTDVMPYP